MRRADRLFEIIQVLRRASGPMTAEAIAAELETSRRTVYRDITALIGQRVPIRGEAGIGYVLERGFDLPPLMLTLDETEAIVLGSQWVVAHADPALARAALDVLAKVAAIVPAALRGAIDDPAVGTPPAWRQQGGSWADIGRLRSWSRQGRKLTIGYTDEAGSMSERTVWPFMIGYVEGIQVLAAWCELRQGFRTFRTDRLTSVEFLDQRYPEHRTALRKRWLKLMDDERAQRDVH